MADPQRDQDDLAPHGHSVIAIAASAGGLEAMTQLLNALPDRPGASLVVAQHMSPSRKSLLATLLGRETRLPVIEIGGDTVPAPDTVYVIPPNSDVIVREGRLSLVTPQNRPGVPKPSADRLFASLADGFGSRAVGIVLSGTGHDGSDGVRSIRGAGGITIAQDADSAKHDGMPLAAAATGCVDLILPPAEIGRQIGRILRDRPGPGAGPAADAPDSPVGDVLQILFDRTGIDFRDYKDSTVNRRIHRRMIALGLDAYPDYVRLCRDSETETATLYRDLMISVTRFFRDPEEFEALAPTIAGLVRPDGPRPVRVWVPGCATGQEAYSLAMMFAEALGGPDRLTRERVQIFATDIDGAALDRARRGDYPLSALEDVPERLREPYCLRRRGRLLVRPELRSVILFSHHNVIQDPPFINLDLVSFRNLLIYFGARLQKRVLTRLCYALSRRGVLFLGRSETIGVMEAEFEALPESPRIFRRRPFARRVPDPMRKPGLPAPLPDRTPARVTPASRRGGGQDLFDATVRGLAPHAVLVTEKHDIVSVYGDLSPFVELSEASNLTLRLSLLRKPLRDEARALCTMALRQGERRRGLSQPMAGPGFTHVQLEAVPIRFADGGESYVLVTFSTSTRAPRTAPDSQAAAASDDARIRQLEADVMTAHEALQQTIEELQAANEELQSVNEELQSTNEELQASNEELETSNEELQSTNEELITVNEALQSSSAELDALGSELESILDATPAIVLVVNSALEITRASQAARRFFDLGPSHAGTRMSDCRMPKGFPDLVEVAGAVFDGRRALRRSFTHDDRAYRLDCAPYMLRDGVVQGVNLVIAEIEPDSILLVRETLRQLEFAQHLAGIATFRLDLRTESLSWSPEVFRIHGRDPDGAPPTLDEAVAYYDTGDRLRIRGAVSRAIERGEEYHLRCRITREDGKAVWVETSGGVVTDADGAPSSLIGIIRRLDDAPPLSPDG